MEPIEEMASTRIILSNSPFTMPAMVSRSFVMPVDVSLCVTSTVVTSGSSFSACRICSGMATSPSGNFSSLTLAPYADAILRKRSPKLPMVTPRTRSPGESVLTTAASIAPVPDDVRTYRSFSVWKARLRLAVVRRSISANSTPRWSIISLLIAL